MNKNKNPIRVLGISGSLRTGSYTSLALQTALEGAREMGAETQLVDLREYELVFHGQVEEKDYPADVFRLRQEVKNAQGVILGTPEYHGSFSGVLKNALDLMGFEEFEGKMLGLIGVSAGRLGAINALNSLRNIGRVLHAWVIPEQVGIPEVWKQFDDNGQIQDSDLRQRVLSLGRQVARFSFLHNSEHVQEFLNMWEQAPTNPGGGKH